LLEKKYKNYKHYNIDVRNDNKLKNIFKKHSFDAIIHAAAQPSHDWSNKKPFIDFDINAMATFKLLELFKKYSPEATFIFVSTNKVYGDKVNFLPYVELDKRFEFKKNHRLYNGITEDFGIDSTMHGFFGTSKLVADILVQEYGKFFNLKTGIFRCGCITGSAHKGAKQHGFLAYLVRCIKNNYKYTVYGYKGKQVRDNIHAYDLVSAFNHFILSPKIASVYNMGGSRHANISILEAIEIIESLTGKKLRKDYCEQNRKGDHIWYITNINKFSSDYPGWAYKYKIEDILEEIIKNN